MGTLLFHPLTTAVDISFWHELTTRKLEQYRLNEDAVQLMGYYTGGTSAAATTTTTAPVPPLLSLTNRAFQNDASPPVGQVRALGTLRNTNTLEAFKTIDKTLILQEVANEMWEDMISGRAITSPQCLARFLLLTFADLKKHHFYYWFAFPAFPSVEPITVTSMETLAPTHLSCLIDAYEAASRAVGERLGFFLARLGKSDGTDTWVGPLDTWTNDPSLVLGFLDPSSHPNSPGWMLRNFLTMVSVYWRCLGPVRVLCLRLPPGHAECQSTLLLTIHLPPSTLEMAPKAVGWERNARGKLGPRMVDLSAVMDPLRLAESSVDLNLKLMRWRMMPSLDPSRMTALRCLLLGAGTLGCHVARGLMAWGVRYITFVDNGTVSYSNPVRQWLYEFDDCTQATFKAKAAAQSLKRIFPSVVAEGRVLSIPMPGHAITSAVQGQEDRVRHDVEELRALFASHDVVFLLTDTRESRWLPTLLALDAGKPVLNAALGFDSFLVMRHGMLHSGETPARQRLGCYFCNDVVAPQNSVTERTLDQQCTVTRPAVSALAGAMAVELCVSLLHHPHQFHAPADAQTDVLSHVVEYPLGIVPHQIRGFLAHFANILVTGEAFNRCIACSECVLREFRTRGFDFLCDAFNGPTYLEDLTGLSEMKREADNIDIEWKDEDDGDEEFVDVP